MLGEQQSIKRKGKEVFSFFVKKKKDENMRY